MNLGDAHSESSMSLVSPGPATQLALPPCSLSERPCELGLTGRTSPSRRGQGESYPGKVAPPFGTWATKVPPLVSPGCLQLLVLRPVRPRLREHVPSCHPCPTEAPTAPELRDRPDMAQGRRTAAAADPASSREAAAAAAHTAAQSVRGNLGQKGERTGSSNSHGRGEHAALVLTHGPKYSPSFLLCSGSTLA